MINAAIVGLGWWGKTLVESGENSDVIRFVAGATRTVSPEIEAFAKRQTPAARRRTTKRCSPIRRSTRSCLPRRTRMHAVAGDRGGGGRQARVLRKAVHADQERSRRGGRCRAQGRRHARARLQPPLSPRDDEAARARPLRRARHHPACRSDDDVPECAVAQAGALARTAGRDAVRRTDADGRARGRRHDRPVRRDRPRLLPELSARRRRSTPTTRHRCCFA